MEKLWLFEYLEMGCNGSDHVVGFVTSLCVIKIKTNQWTLYIDL